MLLWNSPLHIRTAFISVHLYNDCYSWFWPKFKFPTVIENPKFDQWISKLNDIFQNFVSAFPFFFHKSLTVTMSMENFEKKFEYNTLTLKFHVLILSLAHLVDIRMTSNSCSSCRTQSGNNINHSIGKSSLFKGQEISITNFGIFKSPQKRTNYFKDFSLSLLSL